MHLIIELLILVSVVYKSIPILVFLCASFKIAWKVIMATIIIRKASCHLALFCSKKY